MKTSANIKSFYTVNPKKVSAPTPPVAVKAHFGNYVALFKVAAPLLTDTATKFATFRQELVEYPCLRGWLYRFTWRDLESIFGNYQIGFDAIDAVIEQLPPGKRLIILFEYKSIDSENRALAEHVVPDYLMNATYDGGEILYDSTNGQNAALGGGWEIRLWNANVRDRLIALAQALGERYNGNDKFEGIGVTEAAFQNPLGTLPDDWSDQLWIGLAKFTEALKSNFPNCFVFLFINYLDGRQSLNKAINGGIFGSVSAGQYNFAGLKNLGIGMGGPNTLPNEYGLGGFDSTKPPPHVIGGTFPGIYKYYPQMSNEIVLCPSQQRPDWEWTNLALDRSTSGGHAPTVPEVLVYARDVLRANYCFLTRAVEAPFARGYAHPDTWVTVKAYYDANPALKNDITGGLNTTKPACYAAMKTD